MIDKELTANTPRGVTLKDVEQEAIRAVLEQTDGNRSQSAKRLGIARQTLLNKIKEYGL